ncbi:MAG: helicase-related protein, partial [Tepidiformaceae bacterium]
HVAGFDRPNLRFDVERVPSKKVKAERIAAKLRELKDESAIVYCGTRKNVEALTDYLQTQKIKCARYHAGMKDEDRRRIQDAFARDSLRIIVATNAFGMGIDKPDVRLVLHHDMTDSLESYYQEAGRAGRDGAAAECVLYFGARDRQLRDFFIEMSHPEPQRVVEVYRDLVAYSGQRVHVRELMHSGDEPGVNAAIQALVDSGLATRQGYMVAATRAGGEDEIDTAGLEQHRQNAIAKVDAMQRYAESRTCLRARILDYFGDSEHAVACGNCGPCIAPPVTARDLASEDEEAMFQQLRAVRRRFAEEGAVPPFVIFNDATLREMARLTPRSRSEMLNVSGVGQVKYEKYGEAFLAVTRSGSAGPAPAPAPATARRAPRAGAVPKTDSAPGKLTTSLRDTLELYEDGLDIEQIARQRSLAPSTIATHLAQLIHFGHINDLDSLITPGLVERVREVAGPGPVGQLTPLREALGGEVPYEQLHLARAWLNRPV